MCLEETMSLLNQPPQPMLDTLNGPEREPTVRAMATLPLRVSVSGALFAQLPHEEQLAVQAMVEQAIADRERQRAATPGHRAPAPPTVDLAFGPAFPAPEPLPPAEADALRRAIAQRLRLPGDDGSASARRQEPPPPAAALPMGVPEDPLEATSAGVCICASNLPASAYPTLDPRWAAGPGPFTLGIFFHEDAVRLRIEDDPSITGCQMRVGLAAGPGITWA
jgi:hypothetical protein